MQLQKTRENVESAKSQLAYAEQAYEKALQVKKIVSCVRKTAKIQEAREALRASERAAWQAKVADTLEQFEVGGVDSTHTEMINRLNEETAKNEARMEIALDSVDTKTMEIEIDAEKMRASELVKQFKLEMQQTDTTQAPSAMDNTPEETSSGKTLGRTKTKS